MQTRLDRAVRLVRDAEADERGAEVPQALLEGLGDAIPGTCACFHELEPRTRRSIRFQSSDPVLPHDWSDAEAIATFWRLYPQMAPLRYVCDGTLARGEVVTLSDFVPERSLERTELYQDYLRPRGQRYAIVAALPALPGRIRGFTIFRADRDFTATDRALLVLLRPHLQALYRARQRRRSGIADLTPRQRYVLRCVARGYGTEQVAALMGVDASTVRKHLENIYARLGVHSRAAAVGRALAAD